MNKKFNIKIFLICILIFFVLLGGIGSLFTTGNTNSEWYQNIKPEITPPNFVFPIVWNILFLLISLSFYFSFVSTKKNSQKRNLILLFGANLILNFLWSIFFFGLKLPKLAFADLILLWISIGVIFIERWRIKKLSSWLILPYWLWVSFAGVLNWLIAFG